MCKKLCFLILSVLMLSLTSTSYGEVVIGNFEQQMDGWAACTWGPPGNPTFSYSTNEVTLDSYSLKAVQPTDGFNWFLINTNVNGDAFRANNIISIDVTRLANEWTRGTGDHWCWLDLRVQDNNRYQLTGLGNGGDWDSNDLNANDTMTVTWDYTLFKNQMPAAATGVEIVIATNNGGYTGNGTWYIDNIQLLTSRNEQPRSGAWGVELNPTLKWDEASPSDTFDVYVGTDFNDVNDADRVSQAGLLFYSENQDPNSYPLSGTTNGTTYYWRIDDVIGGTPVKGTVWHFTTFLLGAKSTVIGNWEQQMDGWVAVNPDDANMVLGYSTAGATLNNYSLTVEAPIEWYETVLIPINETGFTHQFMANNRFSLDVTWNTISFGGDIESIVIDGDGIGRLQLAPMSETIIGSAGSLDTTTFTWDYSAIDFSLLPAEPETLTLSIATMADVRGLYYFDNARLYNSKVASHPMPGDNTAEAQREPTLSWRPGEGADTHDVYFGTDYDKVNDASKADHPGLLFYDEDLAYDANNIDITDDLGYPLSFGTTYYWRVDEVNEVVWKGAVWSFTVGWYLVVDDFEDYNDVSNRIYDTWSDYFVNNTGMTVGHFDPPFAEKSIVHSGSQAMYMTYDNDGTVNEDTDYEQSGTLLYSETERQWTDPQDWTRESAESLTIWFKGLREPVGSFTEGPPITMTAGGADIWDMADEFHFVYKQISGIGSIAAKVVSVSNTDPWAKAGVMIRQSLEPGSSHASMVVTPENGVSFQRRTAVNAVSEQTQQADITAPQWVKLTRSGNTFTGEYSADGKNWQAVDSITMPLLTDVYIGLCLTSHNVDETCTAEFSDINISGTVTGDWQSQDIGIKSNIPEPMYVILEDNTGNSAVVTHPDPAASATVSWTDWNIPFADLIGLNMQAIKSLVIGVGDRANTQPGGAGTLYIDDIRLYRPALLEPEP